MSTPHGFTSEDDSNEFVNIQYEMEQVIAKVNKAFMHLLDKLGVREKSHVDRLLHDLEVPEKRAYLAFCVDVCEGNEKFTNDDESMLRTLDNDHTVDCIRILALSHRIQHADHEWLESFVSCGGVSVLVETVDNCLSMTPKNVHALLKVIQCIRTVISKHSLEVVTSTRGAIHACVMSLDFKFGPLAVDVLELLNTFCGVSEMADAAAEVYSALQLLSKKVDVVATDRPFSFLVRAVQSDNASIRFSALQFINRLMIKLQGDMNEAIHFRLALTKAGLPEAINVHRSAVEARIDSPMEKFTQPAINKDKCCKKDFGMPMKADTSGAKDSRFEGMEDTLLYAVDLNGDSLSFWVVNADMNEEEFQEQTNDYSTSRGVGGGMDGDPNFVVPVSSIKDIVEYSGDVELQANYDQIFRVDMSDGTKLNFPFGSSAAEQRRWKEWISALQHAVLRKKLELAVWPTHNDDASLVRNISAASKPVFDQASLWKKQVEMNDLLLNKEKINMINLRDKRLFQHAYFILDYNSCVILQESEDKQDEMIKRSVDILAQLARVSLDIVAPGSVNTKDDELIKAKIAAAAANDKIGALEREVEHLKESLKMAAAAASAAADEGMSLTSASQTLSNQLSLKENRIQFLEEENKRLLDQLQAATAAATAAAVANATALTSPAAAQAATPGVEDVALRLKASNSDEPPSKPAASAGFGALFDQIHQKRAPAVDNAAKYDEQKVPLSVSEASSSASLGAAVVDAGDDAPLSELSAEMQENYNKCIKMAKTGIAPGAVRIKMEGFKFPAKYIEKLFKQANLGDAGIVVAAPVDPNAGAGVAKLFVHERKKHAQDATRLRTNVPVKKVGAMEAAKSSLWRNIEETDLDWGELDSDFSTVVEPKPAAGTAAVAGTGAVAAGIGAGAGAAVGASKASMFAEMQQKAKVKQTTGKPFVPSDVTPRYVTIIEDIKQYQFAPSDALRELIVGMDPKNLTVEKCPVLLRSFPSEQEVDKLEKCSEEDLKDNLVAEFFTTLSKIPRCKERIEFHLAICTLPEKLESLATDLGVAIRNVENGVSLLQNCRPDLESFVSMVLSICNYLNARTPNAAAFAITLESMTKLGAVRSKATGRSGYTVLHAVDEQMTKRRKQLFWQDSEWDIGTLSLAAAGINSLTELQEVWKGLSRSIAICKQEISVCESLKNAGNYPPDLFETMNKRFSSVEALLLRFHAHEKDMEEVQGKVDELLVEYCVDVSGGCSKGTVFELFSDLGKQCKLAYFDNNPAIGTTSSVVRQRQKRVQIDANEESQNLSTLSPASQMQNLLIEKLKGIRKHTRLSDSE